MSVVVDTNGLARSDEQAERYFHHYFDQWEALVEAVEVDLQLDHAAPVEFMALGAECWRRLAEAQGRRYAKFIVLTPNGPERLAALNISV